MADIIPNTMPTIAPASSPLLPPSPLLHVPDCEQLPEGTSVIAVLVFNVVPDSVFKIEEDLVAAIVLVSTKAVLVAAGCLGSVVFVGAGAGFEA
jgi:hypothetical protein